MGGCAGKNKSKKSNSYKTKSDSTKKPKSRTKDNDIQSNSLPSSLKNLPSSNGLTVNNNNNNHISNIEENDIDPDIQTMIEQQTGITKALRQKFPSRVISVTDSELEYELANLIYGHPENDYAENPIVPTIFKSTEV